VRLLVCGGRDYGNTVEERNALHDELCRLNPDVIIHGAASGADSCAGMFARHYAVECVEYPANWYKHGRAAGPIRNQQMIDEGKPDAVLAAPGGRGTADMIRRAEAAGLPIHRLAVQQKEGQPK